MLRSPHRLSRTDHSSLPTWPPLLQLNSLVSELCRENKAAFPTNFARPQRSERDAHIFSKVFMKDYYRAYLYIGEIPPFSTLDEMELLYYTRTQGVKKILIENLARLSVPRM